MATTGYGHATFFIEAQVHAGDALAQSIESPGPVARRAQQQGRGPASVAADRADVQGVLARLSAQKCLDGCAQLAARRTAQLAKLYALNVEFDEAIRLEKQADQTQSRLLRVEAQRDAAERDPVTGALSTLLGTSVHTVDLLLDVTSGLLLEAVACLSWTITLHSSHTVTAQQDKCHSLVTLSDNHSAAPCAAGLVESNRVTMDHSLNVTASNLHHVPALRLYLVEDREVAPGVTGADLIRLLDGVESDLVPMTVSDIRRFFRCSQRKAMNLRRAFFSELPPMSPAEGLD